MTSEHGKKPLLSVRDLHAWYGESHALHGVNLDVAEGETVTLLGRNGVGKTTLLNCVMGLLSNSSGEIKFLDEDVSGLKAEQRVRLGIGYVPQGRMIFPLLTVEENLRIGLPARRDLQKLIPSQIFDLFPALADMRQRRGGDLSGGQQQQLAIGRALVLEPRLLILDEPCEGIQPNIVQEIGDVIMRLNESLGLTVLLVEQKLPFAKRVADRFCIMDKGRVVAGGSIDKLDDQLAADYLTV